MVGTHVHEALTRESKLRCRFSWITSHASGPARRQLAARPFARRSSEGRAPACFIDFTSARHRNPRLKSGGRCIERRHGIAELFSGETIGGVHARLHDGKLRPKLRDLEVEDLDVAQDSAARATGGNVDRRVSATRNSVWTEWSSTRPTSAMVRRGGPRAFEPPGAPHPGTGLDLGSVSRELLIGRVATIRLEQEPSRLTPERLDPSGPRSRTLLHDSRHPACSR